MTAVRFLPMALAIVAEGAWISVLAGFVQELQLRDATLGLAAFILAAALGAAATRTIGRRWPDRWPWIGLGLLVVGALAGLLAAPDARAAVASGRFGLDGALGANLGGLLLGLAVLRGMSHAHLPLDDDRLGRVLMGGAVALALTAGIGGVVTEPFRSRFETDALLATVVFLAATLLALALTRLSVQGAETGADWPRNPVWVGLVVAVILLAEAGAILSAGYVGLVLEVVFGIALAPLVVAGLLFGWTRRTIVAFAALGVIAFVIVVLGQLASNPASTAVTGGVAGAGANSAPGTGPSQNVQILTIVVVLFVAAVVVLLLIRAWMRRAGPMADELDETRTIDAGIDEAVRPPHRRWRLPVQAAPGGAAAAYRALLHDLRDRPTVARRLGETPREHARRLHGDGWGRLGLDLLAADYALERFAGMTLSAGEDRRGIGRWRRLRSELRPIAVPAVEAQDEPRMGPIIRLGDEAPAGPPAAGTPAADDARGDVSARPAGPPRGPG
ncbi:MAG TPA: DUF4129 domain-containing protein [Candidatus Limnocylindrales bacterium]